MAFETFTPLPTNVTRGKTGEISETNRAYSAINELVEWAQTNIVNAAHHTDLQAALNAGAGKAVYAPTGVYEGNFTIPANTWLFGDGEGRTIIQPPAGSNTYTLRNVPSAEVITISDLTVDGRKSTMALNANAPGIYLLNCGRARLHRLRVIDTMGHGVHLSNNGAQISQLVSDVVIQRAGSDPLGTYGSNFAVTSANGLTLTNVHCLDSAKAGFRLTGNNITLNGCIALRNGNGGLAAVSSDVIGLTVNGGIYSDNGPAGNCDGLRLLGVIRATMTGVIASGNSGSGITMVNASRDATINGGVFLDNGKAGGVPGAVEGRDGITLIGDSAPLTDVTITGVRSGDRQATKTQQAGVRLKGDVDYVIVSGSNLRHNAVAGVQNTSTTGSTITTANNLA